MERITIADVARHAGVSQTTVSRVLNDDPAVRKSTRENVVRSMRLLRFQPNQAARSLAGRRAARVGIFFEKPYGGYNAELVIAALRECSFRGHMLVAEEFDAALATSDLLVNVDRSIGVLNGVLLPPLRRPATSLVERLKSHNLPTVAFSAGDAELHGAGACTVGIHDRAAARELTHLLLAKGHQRIGFIGGLALQSVSRQRYEGFCQALDAKGMSPDPDLAVHGDFSFKSGVEAMEVLLDRAVPPTAVFASNDDMAVGAITVANRRGFRVPEDVAVVGFDDSPIAQFVSPSLTSVKQPVEEMVRAALDVLEADPRFTGVVAGEGVPPAAADHRYVDHSLIERESSGKGPKVSHFG